MLPCICIFFFKKYQYYFADTRYNGDDELMIPIFFKKKKKLSLLLVWYVFDFRAVFSILESSHVYRRNCCSFIIWVMFSSILFFGNVEDSLEIMHSSRLKGTIGVAGWATAGDFSFILFTLRFLNKDLIWSLHLSSERKEVKRCNKDIKQGSDLCHLFAVFSWSWHIIVLV